MQFDLPQRTLGLAALTSVLAFATSDATAQCSTPVGTGCFGSVLSSNNAGPLSGGVWDMQYGGGLLASDLITVVLKLGTTLPAIPIPAPSYGCSMSHVGLGPFVVMGLMTGSTNYNFVLTLPAAPGLIGLPMAAQAVGLDTGPGDFFTGNALDGVFGCPATFSNMVFANEVGTVPFGSGNTEHTSINGNMTVSPAGIVNGSVTIQLSDLSVARLNVVNDAATLTYGSVTIDLLTNSLSSQVVLVNGILTTVDTIMQTLFNETNFTGISALSDQSRALVALASFMSTPQAALNRGTAQSAQFGPSFWCKAYVLSVCAALLTLGAVACAALVAGCVGTVVIPGVGAVSCGTALILCNGLLASGTGLYGLVLAELWN